MSELESREELLARLCELGGKLHSIAEDLASGKLKAKEANLAVKAYSQEVNVIRSVLKYAK